MMQKMQLQSIARDPIDDLLDLADQADFDLDDFDVPTLQLPQKPQQLRFEAICFK